MWSDTLVDEFRQPGDMFRRRFRDDAMTEIEDIGTRRDFAEEIANSAGQALAAGDQNLRVEIALQRERPGQGRSRPTRRDASVETETLHETGLGKIEIAGTNRPRKHD